MKQMKDSCLYSADCIAYMPKEFRSTVKMQHKCHLIVPESKIDIWIITKKSQIFNMRDLKKLEHKYTEKQRNPQKLKLYFKFRKLKAPDKDELVPA